MVQRIPDPSVCLVELVLTVAKLPKIPTAGWIKTIAATAFAKSSGRTRSPRTAAATALAWSAGGARAARTVAERARDPLTNGRRI